MTLIAECTYSFHEFRLDPSRRKLMRAGVQVPISPRSFDVLLYLVQHAETVVLKDDLLKGVWPDSFVEETNLSQHVFWIRKALGDRATCIATIPGRGYEFRATVTCEVVSNRAEERRVIQAANERVEDSLQNPAGAIEPLQGRRRSSSLRLRWITVAVVVMTGALTAWGIWFREQRVVPGDHHGVVLAEFTNETGDRDLGRTLRTLLGIDLSQSPYLVIADDPQLRETLKLMDRPPDTPIADGVAAEICQRLNDQVVLNGEVASFGKQYVISLKAVDCQSGRGLVESKETAESREGLVHAVDSATSTIRRRLGEALPSQQVTYKLLPVHTVSLEALRSYSQAMSMVTERRASIPLLRRAVELDPQFAWGYFELASTYSFEGESALQKEYLQKAYSMRDQLNDYQRRAVTDEYEILNGVDPQKRLLDLQSWAALYPNQAQPLGRMVDLYKTLGEYEEAIAPARRSMALQPNEVGAYIQLASSLAESGHTQEAKAVCQEAFRRHLDSIFLRVIVYGIAIQEHDQATIAAQDAWAKGNEDGVAFPVWRLFGEGKVRQAVQLQLQSVQELRDEGFQEHAEGRLRFLMHRESLYKMTAPLREQMKSVDVRKYPDNLVFVLADMGRVKDAEMEFRMIAKDDPSQAETGKCSEARSAVDVAEHHLNLAISALEPCTKYGMSAPEAFVMLGQDYLDAGKPDLAELEFRFLLGHSYATMGFLESIARLGLARALTRKGDYVNGRLAYEAVFAQWKDADPDLPLLLQARREYAVLRTKSGVSEHEEASAQRALNVHIVN